jgi:hypothetical protein
MRRLGSIRGLRNTWPLEAPRQYLSTVGLALTGVANVVGMAGYAGKIRIAPAAIWIGKIVR